jgi:glycosyltransferase involved in cell wall biosynthesis/ubiquinone/menaquinone biosynthesis C-methylase UbiE
VIKVSVIIPTYNRANFVCEAINSCLNQTFRNFEIIVIDDGSTDNTKEALKRYGSSIRYVYQENQGRAEARNRGIKLAEGEYIAFLDDDDLWLPQKLERQVNFLDFRPQISLAQTFVEIIDAQGNLLKGATEEQLQLYKKAVKADYTYEAMSRSCIMLISTVIVRRECFDKVGFFDPDTESFEDWDFYLRFALKYNIGTIPEFLTRFRRHRKHTTMGEFTHGRIKTLMKHLALLDSGMSIPLIKRIRHNFYLNLANAYYIDRQWKMSREYLLKVIKLKPWALFQGRLVMHFLLSFIRQSKQFYPERIIPQEISGGPLAAHLTRYDFVKQFCKDKIILDAACGAGYGSDYLAHIAKEVRGVDISEEAIIYAKEHYKKENIHFGLMNIYNLKFPDKYFDIVCSFETMEHLDKPDRFLSEVKRVLKEDGIFVLSTPHVKKTSYNPNNPYHRVEFSKQDFEDILREYFVNIEIFGQRRRQSKLHFYLQQIDFFHLRAMLPDFLRRGICHASATRSWDEASLEDFIITKDKIKHTLALIGVCKR